MRHSQPFYHWRHFQLFYHTDVTANYFVTDWRHSQLFYHWMTSLPTILSHRRHSQLFYHWLTSLPTIVSHCRYSQPFYYWLTSLPTVLSHRRHPGACYEHSYGNRDRPYRTFFVRLCYSQWLTMVELSASPRNWRDTKKQDNPSHGWNCRWDSNDTMVAVR